MVMLLSLLMVGMFLSSCENNTTGPGNDGNDNQLQLSQESKAATKASWQMLNTVNTQGQFTDLVSGKKPFLEDQEGMINSMPEIRQENQRMKKIVSALVKSKTAFQRTTSDSLIFFQEWVDSISGTAGRRALWYDPVTGNARLYETIYQFPPQVQLTYDSTEIRANLGSNLDDDSDDRLLAVEKLSLFEPNFFVEQVHGLITATAWDDSSNEVIGAIADNNVVYGDQTELQSLQQHAEFNPDGSGSISERTDYRDGTFRTSDVNFYNDFTGEYQEVWRDGTTVSGMFDLLEDDNHAAITRNIVFANHPTLDRVEEAAEFVLNPTDSSSNALVTRKVFFKNGSLDTARVEVARYRGDDDLWREEFDVQTSNDGQSHFLITYHEGYKEIEGEHTTVEGLYVLFNAVEYNDGSGELWANVYESFDAYQNGDPPILVIHIFFNGDGSGKGSITENNVTYNITFTAGGEITVEDNSGNAATVSGY